MKLHMVLAEQGYKPKDGAKRLRVYLTNSLEQGDREVRDLFGGEWLSEEARGANEVKRDQPIMCVIGNPPYLGEGGVSEGWLGNLMDDYKKEPGGKEKLKERNPKWLNDLYVKFIRMSSHMIEKRGEGVLGFITNHGYLDNPTFRGMRWHLQNTFDKIYVLDLHGNSKKKEVSPDGSADVNVFDIQQGVSIIIGVKKSDGKKGLGEIFHGDLWGKRAAKYEALFSETISSELFTNIDSPAPQHPMVKKDFEKFAQFEAGFNVEKFLSLGVLGFQTHRDHFAIADKPHQMIERCNALLDFEQSDQELRTKFNLKDGLDWNINKSRSLLRAKENWMEAITKCNYRPLDIKTCYLSRIIMDRPRTELIQHGSNKENLFLGVGRQGLAVGPIEWCLVTCSEFVFDANVFRRGGVRAMPLYLYPDEQDLDQTRRINFDPKLWKKLQKLAKHPKHGIPDEVQTFDYIYGVLHSPQYRDTYAEFLKTDFPRIPWPRNPDAFWDISAKGMQLRELHLMTNAAIGETPYPFPAEGDSVVDKPSFDGGRVWINKDQYFSDVPLIAWEFCIGGYQPAQKWLKDRKGRELSYDDVMHYQKIIKILSETDRIMKTIEMTL